MIGRLSGKVVAVADDTAIIDVLGVGYEIFAAPRLLQNLGAGDDVVLAIETLVREDLIRLYGFADEAERQAFRLLQTVQGVGAKHALSILQIFEPGEIYDAIAAEDITALSRAHGVGKKLAQRIATELQSKTGAIAGGPNAGRKPKQSGSGDGEREKNHAVRHDAVSALANLGYDGVEARRAVARAAEAIDSPGVEALIKAALKELAAA